MAPSWFTTAREAVERRLDPVLQTTYAGALRRALDAGMIDSAASLTYYLILSLVPCVTLIVGLIGIVGSDPETTDAILEVVENGGSAEAAETVRGGLQKALESEARSGTALGIGVVATLYVASLYVSAFTRASAGIGGGSRRSTLRSRPLQVLVTFAGVILLALALVLLVALEADRRGPGRRDRGRALLRGAVAGGEMGRDRPLPRRDRRRPLLARPHARAPLAAAADQGDRWSRWACG